MEKSALASQSEEGGGIITLITSIDWRYQMWKVGITMTDNVRLEKTTCIQSIFGAHRMFLQKDENEMKYKFSRIFRPLKLVFKSLFV